MLGGGQWAEPPSTFQRIPVRLRLPLAISAAAVAALMLAGCSSSGETPAPSGSASASAAADLCKDVLPTGATAEAVKVSGDAGTEAKATFTAPLEIKSEERAVVSEGKGDKLRDGDLVNLGMTVFDASDGKNVGSFGYKGEALPITLTAGQPLGQVLGCATVGSRFVFAIPKGDASPAAVYVIDVLGITPKKAWGKENPPVAGMPEVTFAKDGEPTITIPKGDAPTEVKLEDLRTGDGATVAPGDTVLVQYKGVKWSDGKEFDSSWSSGAPASFATTGVVEGFKQALEGQKVGSQVVVVIPPKFGYGSQPTSELAKETLVFVVDILASQPPAAAAQ